MTDGRRTVAPTSVTSQPQLHFESFVFTGRAGHGSNTIEIPSASLNQRWIIASPSIGKGASPSPVAEGCRVTAPGPPVGQKGQNSGADCSGPFPQVSVTRLPIKTKNFSLRFLAGLNGGGEGFLVLFICYVVVSIQASQWRHRLCYYHG